jgi:hypothetical protein
MDWTNKDITDKIYKPLIEYEKGFEILFLKKIYPPGKNPKGWFKCFCGNKFEARIQDVKSGHTTSCGCYARKVRGLNIKKWIKKSTK